MAVFTVQKSALFVRQMARFTRKATVIVRLNIAERFIVAWKTP